MLQNLADFREIWVVDFEFQAPPGHRPESVCMVAREYRTGRRVRMWLNELCVTRKPPFSTGPDVCLVAYYASAELGCFLALGWALPCWILDLYVEFRNLTNGIQVPSGNGLLGALTWFGLDGLAAVEKQSMRELVLRGGPYTVEERTQILDYCESDVRATTRLLDEVVPRIPTFQHALCRGRYMKAVARMEHCGVPIDRPLHPRLVANWGTLRTEIVREVDQDYGVFEGTTFKTKLFEQWLRTQGLDWPRLASGKPALDDDTFREMAKLHPQVAPLREVRSTLSQLRLADLAVGPDSRNRCLLSPFSAKTGRNQPSASQFIFGPSTWLRGLIRPEHGTGIAYLDWGQQEFGIAAALSGDEAMMRAYRSGDPYLEFGKMAGAISSDATKASHPRERELYKTVVLAVQYQMGAGSLGRRLNLSEFEAKLLLEAHRSIFRKFWTWSDAAVDYGVLSGRLFTVFGWDFHVTRQTKPRTLRNFPMQANAAEMLRLAICLAFERGVRVVAPVHDALMIEAPINELDQAISVTQEAMAEASEVVLSGFRLGVDFHVIRYPDRYTDPRGERMWQLVMRLLEKRTGSSRIATTHPLQSCHLTRSKAVTPV